MSTTTNLTSSRSAAENAKLTSQPTSWGSPQFTRELRQATAGVRDQVHFLHDTAESIHKTVQQFDLQERTALKNRLGPTALMDELSSERGLSWNEIATAIGVSLSAVRKWRTGKDCSAENRTNLARLAALIDLLDEAMVSEPAGWLLTSVLPGYTVRFLDLVAAGRDDLVLENAFNRMRPTEVLDAFEPSWRDSAKRKFEIAVDGDGIRGFRRLNG
jgi:hypothetical protein